MSTPARIVMAAGRLQGLRTVRNVSRPAVAAVSAASLQARGVSGVARPSAVPSSSTLTSRAFATSTTTETETDLESTPTNFMLSQDLVQLRDYVRRIALEKVAPRADEIDRTAEYPQDMFDMLKELGLFTLPFPAEHGGSDSLLSACVVVEELGRICYNTAYLLLVQWLPISAILAAGSAEQKAKYLPGLAAGEVRGAFSTSEPQSGSDISGIKTKAVRQTRDGKEGYVIDGAKIWCTNASLADFVVVAAKVVAEGQEPPKSGAALNFFVVPKGTPGFTVGRHEDKMGGRGVPSSPLFFDSVWVPKENMLGEEGKGFKAVMEAFNHSRPLIAARGVGLAQGALDKAIDFVKGRRAFGQALSDFQGLRWMIADMHARIEASRLLTYKAACMADAHIKGPEMAKAAATAKLFATDTAMYVATECVQLHGSHGISNDGGINRYMRDAKLLQVVEGTNQIQRVILGRQLLGPEEKRAR